MIVCYKMHYSRDHWDGEAPLVRAGILQVLIDIIYITYSSRKKNKVQTICVCAKFFTL